MKTFLERLVPFFLKTLDRHFLLHRRVLWITKVHYVLFYIGIAFLTSMAYVSWYPKPYDLPPSEGFILLGVSVMLIPFGFWVFRQISFSIERNYGQRFPMLEQIRFGLYIVCTLMFLSIPFGSAWMMQYQVANYISDVEFEKDQKLLNLYNIFFLTDSEISSEISEIEMTIKQNYLLEYNHDDYDHNSYEYPESVLNKIAQETNSIYHFYNPYAMGNYTIESKEPNEEASKTNEEILRPIWEAKHQHQLFITEYIHLLEKYGATIPFTAEELLDFRAKTGKKTGKEVINVQGFFNDLANQKMAVRDNLWRISQEKRHWNNFKIDIFEQLSIVFFLAFFTSLLLSIYNMVQIKDFIIAIVAFMGLGILVAVAGVVIYEAFGSLAHSREFTPFFLIFMLYVLASFQSLRIFFAKRFSRFKVICLILTTFATPFLICWLGLMEEAFRGGYHADSYYIGLIWIGMGLFSIFLVPVFRKLFLKIQSLPKA